MPGNLERYTCETEGANALEPKVRHLRPQLRLVTNSSDGENPPLPENIISLAEFKARKTQELITPELQLIPSISSLRNLRKEIALISAPVKTSIAEFKPEAKIETPKPTQPDLLKGTGFTSSEEVTSLQKKLNDGLSEGLNKDELINKIVTENLMNIRWYQWEYTMSDPIVPNPVTQNENKDLVNSKSGYSIVDMTGEGERDGAVKQSVINTQNLLKNAKEGDAVMIISPPGWTGRIDENSKEIKYPEAEIFAFIKGEGRNIRALTFISELTLEQCQQFKDFFVMPDPESQNKKQSDREKIVEMVTSPIIVTGGRIRFEDILDKVESLKGEPIMREANGANRTFKEAREFLARGDELQKLPDLCEEIIQTYETYLRDHVENINDPNVYNAIKQRMELTVLEIAKTLKGDKKGEPQKQMSIFYKEAMSSINVIDTKLVKNNYDDQIAFLRTRPGCNGGGMSESSSIFGSSLSEILSGGSSFSGMGGSGGISKEGGTCMSCNTKNDCTQTCYKCGGMLLKN